MSLVSLTRYDEVLLESYGWTVACESPFELSHEDGSFATGQAASIVLQYVRDMEEYEIQNGERPWSV